MTRTGAALVVLWVLNFVYAGYLMFTDRYLWIGFAYLAALLVAGIIALLRSDYRSRSNM